MVKVTFTAKVAVMGDGIDHIKATASAAAKLMVEPICDSSSNR